MVAPKSTLLSKAVGRFRREGLRKTLRYSFDTLKHGAHYVFYDRRWDRLECHRTGGALVVPADDMVASSARFQWLPYYQASPRLPVLWTIRALRIDPSQYAFVDYGSGRGRILLTAARFPFSHVVGVEFSRTLHREACENIARYPRELLASLNVSSLNMNVVDYDLPRENCVVFCFNPFPPDVLDLVAGRMEESWKRSPRSIFIVYENSNRLALFSGRPLFQRLDLSPLERLRLGLLAARPFEFFVLGSANGRHHER